MGFNLYYASQREYSLLWFNTSENLNIVHFAEAFSYHVLPSDKLIAIILDTVKKIYTT